jgi:nucleotide-binding universal stress UspA family protein
MESCLQYAEWIIKAMNATADILYVTDAHQFDFAMMGDFSGALGAQPYQRLCDQLKQIETEKTRVVKETVEKFFEKAGLSDKISFKHERGSLVDSCQAYEHSEVGVDLILMGKRGENAAFATEHLGANLERVVRASSKPCFIACRKFTPIKKCALAYDDGPSTRHALQFLIRSPFMKEIPIDLLYVCDEENPPEEVTEMLASAEKTLKDAGYQVNTVCLHDDVSDGIANYVTNNAIDVLIMGAYGHGRIRNLLIGSTTTELMRRCKNSVLLFR